MTPPAAPPPIPLTYEAGLSRERLPDGTLRLTVVTERAGAAALIGTAIAVTVAFVLFLAFGWYRYLPERVLFMAFLAGPMGVGVPLLLLMMPRRQTHVVEASPAGLRVETSIAGDPVSRFHPRDEILAVGGTGALEIRTRKDAYSCMSADEDVVKQVVAAIREELYRDPDATTQ